MTGAGPAQGRRWRGQSPQERREGRRRRLLDAGLELFGTTGYAATSLTALCASAGVSPRHFYELYPGREQLLADLHDELALETARRVRQAHDTAPLSPEARISAGLSTALAYLTADPRRARVLQLEAIGVSSWFDHHRREVIGVFAEATAEQYRLLAADGQLVDRPFGPVATALVGAVAELLVDWLLTEPRRPPEELLPVATEVFLAVFQGRAVHAPRTRSGGAPLRRA
ncbi:MAG: hypothetical protein AVDCRST_MAG16-59 [uncultured Frankineae bacterium]|uniref:HTH tetR-type domain-containing protein n=1 Tax=uncultured Frankineae bacterium TaxID=437475 RepID=A0A6J4KMG4_9ACTN|nr:MAG: hypothetical protein AVDCRST_MAG16-59 [uncultured Frankineae bacterium]